MRHIHKYNMSYLAAYIPREHAEALQKEADRQFSTRSAIMRQIVAEWVKRSEGK